MSTSHKTTPSTVLPMLPLRPVKIDLYSMTEHEYTCGYCGYVGPFEQCGDSWPWCPDCKAV